MKQKEKVFVGRHKALYEYCLEKGYIDRDSTAYFGRVSIKEIKGKDVVGTLSLEMMSYTNTFTEIPIYGCRVQPGVEIDIEDIRISAMPARKYQVKKVV